MWFSLLYGISICFQVLSPSSGQVIHVLLTSSPLAANLSQVNASINYHQAQLVRLACIRHAASVRPEPGSNSHFRNEKFYQLIIICCYSFSKELKSELTSQMFNFKLVHLKLPYTCNQNLVQFSKIYSYLLPFGYYQRNIYNYTTLINECQQINSINLNLFDHSSHLDNPDNKYYYTTLINKMQEK